MHKLCMPNRLYCINQLHGRVIQQQQVVLALLNFYAHAWLFQYTQLHCMLKLGSSA